jgi:fused signal recognition particle receptor
MDSEPIEDQHNFEQAAAQAEREQAEAQAQAERVQAEAQAQAEREQTEAQAQAEREQAEAQAQAAREQAEREQAAQEQAAREQAEREQAEREQAEREQAAQEQAAREQAEREQAEREQAEREQAEREQAEREQAEAQAQAAREQAEREQAAQEQAAREQAEREQAEREQAEREQAEREQAEREQAAQEQAAREQAEREQAEREQAEREQAEAQAQAEREQAAQEQAAREQAAQEQAEREQAEAQKENISLIIEDTSNESVPKLVFIVPYRNRELQKKIFDNVMKNVLEDIPSSDYKVYFIQQCDTRDFNRGAMKNIGFLALKDKYPNDYKNITFVFNDVDTVPRTKGVVDYNTENGTIKHFYGHTNTLGGIFSIKGSDFEQILGFPNFWAWGYEDNMIQIRAVQAGLNIDRSQFYIIGDPNIIQLNENTTRIVNRNEFNRYINFTNEGFSSINNLKYNIDEANRFVNVTRFDTGIANNSSTNQVYDLKNGNRPFNVNPIQQKPRGRRGSTMSLFR